MICKNCGAQNADNAFICINCGSRLEQPQNQSYNYGYSQNNSDPNPNGGNFSQQYNNNNRQYGNNNNAGFNQYQDGAYTYNYNQSYNYTPIDTRLVKKGSIIVALVISILAQNWIALVLAIIALVRCSDFENAVRMGEFQLADQKRASIGKLRKWTWVVLIVGLIISAILAILGFLGIGFGLLDFVFDGFEDFDELYGYSEMLIRCFRG